MRCTQNDAGAHRITQKSSILSALFLITAMPLLAASNVKPDFGPNVLLFDPSMPAAKMQEQIDKVYATQRRNEFGAERNALLFLPGDYHLDVPIGFYTQVLGLGSSPNEVHISGNVHADASASNNNA